MYEEIDSGKGGGVSSVMLTPTKDLQILIPETCGCYLDGKKRLSADVVQLRILR